jgi:hypothetical protein
VDGQMHAVCTDADETVAAVAAFCTPRAAGAHWHTMVLGVIASALQHCGHGHLSHRMC